MLTFPFRSNCLMAVSYTHLRRVGDLKLDFGNPRKIKKQKREDLEESLDKYGDFDIIVINDKDQVLSLIHI